MFLRSCTQEYKDTADSLFEDTEIENIDWYFDPPQQFVPEPPLECDSTTGLEHFNLSTAMNPSEPSIWCDLWLAIGLQHCIPFDFGIPIEKAFDSCGNYKLCHCGVCKEQTTSLAYPMALAFRIVTGGSESRCLSAPSFELLSTKVVDNDLDLLSNLRMGAVNIVRWAGIPASHSTASPVSVFGPMSWSDFNKVVDCCRDSLKTLTSIAIVNNSYIETGVLGDGSGMSSEASNVQVSYVMHSLRSTTSFELYALRCVKKLCSLNIQLLICCDSCMNKVLLDACTAEKIAILSVPSIQVDAFANLLQIRPVDDILDLGHDDVSRYHLHVGIAAECSTDSITQEISVGTDQELFSATICKSESIRFEFANKGPVVVAQFQLVVGLQDACPRLNQLPSAILITAPSNHLVMALEDRFARCLYRMRAIASGARVVRGAGLVECLCYHELDHVKQLLKCGKLEHQQFDREGNLLYGYKAKEVSDGYTENLDALDFMSCMILVIECAQRALLEFVVLIGEKNGLSRMQVSDEFSVFAANVSNALSLLHEFVGSSQSVRLGLRAPLADISSSPVPVLDVLEIKVNAFHSSIEAWKLVNKTIL